MSSSVVKSAERVLRVLETLAANPRPLPTMTIARKCEIPKSSAHHLLNVMRERNFVTYYADERAWGLGLNAFEVGSAYLRRMPVQRFARPLLEDVAARTGETTHLAVLQGADVLYVDKEQPPGEAPQLVTEVGVRLPAHLTAVGRAILAQLPAAQVRANLGPSPLVTRTDHGPRSVDELVVALAEVRRTGFAFDDQMVTPGICCLAAPVFSHEGAPIAAIGIAYLAAQRSRDDVPKLAGIVGGASVSLSEHLGWRSSNGAGPERRES